MSRAMCTCASGCDRHPLADPGVFAPCDCWCHDQRPADDLLDGVSREEWVQRMAGTA